MQQPSGTQQVHLLNQQLTQAFVERDAAQAKVDSSNEKIVAIRNVLAGVLIGQKLQQELDAENAPPKE